MTPGKLESLDPEMLEDLNKLSYFMKDSKVDSQYPIEVHKNLNTILCKSYQDIVIYDYYCKISTVGIFDMVLMFTVKDLSYNWLYRLNPDMTNTTNLFLSKENLKNKYKDIPLPWFRQT